MARVHGVDDGAPLAHSCGQVFTAAELARLREGLSPNVDTMGDDGIGAVFSENVLNHAAAIGMQPVNVMSMICSQFNRALAESLQEQLSGIKSALDRKPTP